ncbi:MAG: hypothetical protein AAF196_16985 [Planctomycetota bacterium]
MTWTEAEEAIRRKIDSDLAALSPVWVDLPPSDYSRDEDGVNLEYVIQYGSVAPKGVGVYADRSAGTGDRTTGFVQFDVYFIQGSGPRPAHEAGDAVRGAFQGQRIQLPQGGSIRFGTPFPSNGGRDGAFLRRIVTVPFEADDI